MTARTTSQHMAPWNPRTSLTTTESLFGSCGGQLWSFWKEQEWSNYEFHRAKLTCHNEEWKQIKLQSFEHVKVWKRFKMFEIFEVSPCRVIPLCSYPTHLNIFKGNSRAFLRHWIWSSLSRVLWAPKAHTSLAPNDVFTRLCRAFVRQGVCILCAPASAHTAFTALRSCWYGNKPAYKVAMCASSHLANISNIKVGSSNIPKLLFGTVGPATGRHQ